MEAKGKTLHAPHLEPRPITLGAACVATLCAALWGGLAVAIIFTQEQVPPFCTAGLRFAFASLFMAAWARWDGVNLSLQPGEGKRVALAGLLLFAQIGSFHWGLTLTNSSHASVLIGAHPVFVAVLAHFVLIGDRLTWQKLAGLLISSVGMLLVLATRVPATGDQATLLGDAVILGSSLLLGISMVYTKTLLARMPAAKILFWSYCLGTAGFLGVSAALEPLDTLQFTPASFWALIYQSVLVAGFCFAAWTALLRRHRASQLVVFSFGQPLFGMLFGNLFRGDPLTLWLAIGGLAIALGILLVTRN